MLRRVLCVDDEPNLLRAFERQLRAAFDFQMAVGPELGLEAISHDGPFAVIVSDLRMPGMDGIEFLERAQQLSPDSVRIMLTGQAELETTIDAVNRGGIFRFLTKPCPVDVFREVLERALEQHRRILSERQLLEETLQRSIGVLTEALSLCNPLAFTRAQHIRHYVKHLADRLGLADAWQYELAAMLSQIGCVAVPPEVLEKLRNGEQLNAEEARMIESQSQVGSELLSQIPRLDAVAQMVARQADPWKLQVRDPDRITIGAQLLKIAQDFDDAVVRGNKPDRVVNHMRKRAEYNADFVGALEHIQLAQDSAETRLVTVRQLRTRMIVNADVFSNGGLLLLAKGQEVTGSALLRLHNFAATTGVVEPISALVPFPTSPFLAERRSSDDDTAVPDAAGHTKNTSDV